MRKRKIYARWGIAQLIYSLILKVLNFLVYCLKEFDFLKPHGKKNCLGKRKSMLHLFFHTIELTLAKHARQLSRARLLSAWCEFELIHTDTRVWVACSHFSNQITGLSSSVKSQMQNSVKKLAVPLWLHARLSVCFVMMVSCSPLFLRQRSQGSMCRFHLSTETLQLVSLSVLLKTLMHML